MEKLRKGYKIQKWHFGKKFEIPQHWEVREFREGIKFLTDYESNGSYAKLAEFAQVGVGKPYAWFVRSTDLEKNRIGFVKGNKYVNKSSYDFLTKTKLYGGELIMMKVGSIGNVYLLPKLEIPATLGNNLYLIFTNEKLLSPFAFYWFSSHLGQSSLFRIASSTTLPSINKENTKSCLVFFPPISEQQKITSILSNIDELIKSYKKIIDSNKKLKVGLLQFLFTKGIDHKKFKKTKLGICPENWKITTIGNHCKVATGGTPNRSNKEYYNGNIPWVKTAEVKYNIITDTDEHITPKALKESSTKVFPKNTLLFAMYGQGITRGRCAILGTECAINQACAAIIPNENIDVWFLYYWLFFRYEKLRILSTGTNQSNFNLDKVRKIQIFLPPISEQQKITSILSNIDELIENNQEYKFKLEKLKKGLMENLLTGNIRVKI